MKYKGRELANPIVILRRLTALAIIYPAMAVVWIALVLGYGVYEANQKWNNVL